MSVVVPNTVLLAQKRNLVVVGALFIGVLMCDSCDDVICDAGCVATTVNCAPAQTCGMRCHVVETLSCCCRL